MGGYVPQLFEIKARDSGPYVVYSDGEEVSRHTTERKAVSSAEEVAFGSPDSIVFYRHEYEVDVLLTNQGVTIANQYAGLTDTPPSISSTPNPVFQQGIPLVYAMSQHVADDGLSPLVYGITNPLPNGLAFNSSSGVLSYDGIATASVSSHQLTATDAVGSAQSLDFNINITGASSFAAPAGYSGFVTDWNTLASSTSSRILAADNAYGPPRTDWAMNGGEASTFYGPADNLTRHMEWGARTGNDLSDYTNARDRSYHGWLVGWLRTGLFSQSRVWQSPEVAYYGLIEGWGGTWNTGIVDDIEDNITTFSFRHYGQLYIGSRENQNQEFYGRFTARSRPVAHLIESAVLYRIYHGTDWLDEIDGTPINELLVDCAVTHLYRWRHEFVNYNDVNAQKADTFAPFMLSKTIEALRKYIELEVSLGRDPDRYNPTNVLHGENAAGLSFVPNPYATIYDAIIDILDWFGGAINGHTPDTRAHPVRADYARLIAATGNQSTGGGEPSDGPQALGDPMMYPISGEAEGDYAMVLYRNGNGQSYKSRNIQMMNVINYWWMASVLDGSDNVRRDEYMDRGDKIFYGSVLRDMGTVTNQKARNQSMNTVYEALEYRNIVAGRND